MIKNKVSNFVFNMFIKNGGVSKEIAYLTRASRKYYKERGWFDSIDSQKSVNAHGNGLPWFCYQSIDFLEKRIKPEFLVFEFGMGGSTDWWSRHVREVKSVDHDRSWFRETKKNLRKRKNIELFLCEVKDSKGLSHSHEVFDENLKEDNGYADKILDYEKYFDIIVIDGIVRNKCTINSLKALKEDGVIIFDNSEREIYRDSFKTLKNSGFRELEFFDFGPCNLYRWKTSVFYRTANCLGI